MAQSDFWKETSIGSLLMVGIKGPLMDVFTLELIKKYRIEKFILFSRNAIQGPDVLYNLCCTLKHICNQEGLTPLIAIDQEGGPVRRLRPPAFKDMPSQEDVLKAKDPFLKLAEMTKSCSSILKDLEIDINLAPVLDVPLGADNHVLKDRCLGKNLKEVADRGVFFIKAMQKKGIRCVAKHFPGIGRVCLDPHFELPTVPDSLEQVMLEAFPFKEAIKGGVYGIMTSHVVYKQIDYLPATFSKRIVIDILKKQFSFKGPVFSDDLDMKGLNAHFPIDIAAVRAINAGHDVILICQERKNIIKALCSLKKAFLRGEIDQDRIKDAITRQKNWSIL